MSQIQPTLYLDVRTSEEYKAGRIEPSVNVPIDELPGRVGTLGSRRRKIVVFCRTGRRSAIALAILRAAGFTDVRDAGAIENVRAT
jgi:phage shock protein E